MTEERIRKTYAEDGFVVLRHTVAETVLRDLEQHFLGLVERLSGRRFEDAKSNEFSAWLSQEREVERQLYDSIRTFDWLLQFSTHESITEPVKRLIGSSIGVLEKIPFRIDLPMMVRELAVWHQDYFYVKGNTDTVTAWIPLQDTAYEVGCLMVMPGSHKLGPVPHTKQLLQKKFVPAAIFDRPVRYVEMCRGDLLLFNALTLHSSGNNISERIRYSVQARYSDLSQVCDPGMGRLIPV